MFQLLISLLCLRGIETGIIILSALLPILILSLKFQDMQLFPVVICNSFEDFNLAFRLSHNGFEEVIYENLSAPSVDLI